MTLNEMLADLNARIGSEPEIDNAQMTYWINQAMRAFCMESDFSWLEKKQTASTVASQAEYVVPTDYKRATEVQIDSTSTSKNVYRFTPHELRDLVETSEKTFTEFGGKLVIHPTPSTTTSNNIELWYIRKPTNLTDAGDSPSDSDIANMPEEYHEALILYAFATYNSYDEEQSEARLIMGNPRSPIPGTYQYFVNLAKREDSKKKRGARVKMMSKQEFTGYKQPNRTGNSSPLRL
jgi:hypothetical protein